ncbi:MAG: PrsW family intramembrane metalloprotease [Ignavibacteria bacterium]|nr:PrsW family intramembrane metalloprotease [Ignavibacteria bacterium]
MPVFASALAAFIPIAFYLFFVWKFDRFDREPVGLYLKHFLWGAVGAIILALVGSYLFSFFLSFSIANPELRHRTETIFVAPFVEEITKGVFLLFTISNRKFDNITDGIVYGGAIGLGFGMTENFTYFLTYGKTFENWLMLVLVRTSFTAVMHCVATASFGALLGFAKFKPLIFKIILPPVGLALAMFIHFAWNFSVSFSQTSLLGFLFLSGSIIIFIVSFKLAVKSDARIIFRELYDEAEHEVLPIEHVTILSSIQREQKGWIDERIRKTYIKVATALAFRKMQWRNSTGLNKTVYENEVTFYRNELMQLLNGVR